MNNKKQSREEGPRDTGQPSKQLSGAAQQDDASPDVRSQREAPSKSRMGSNASANRLLGRLQSKTTWWRLLFTVLFLAIWAISRLIFATVASLQIGFLLLGGAANARLSTFGQGLAAYSRQLIAYLTFATDDQPFPLAEWPVTNTALTNCGNGKSAGTDGDSDVDQPEPPQPGSEPSGPKDSEPEATGTDAPNDTTSIRDGDNNETPDVGNGLKGTRSRKEPTRTGGRRTPQAGTPTPKPQTQAIFPPEVVCRRGHASFHWTVMLSEGERTQIRYVRQNGESLEAESGTYAPPSFSDALTVIHANGNERNVPLFEDKPLIFKLSSNWKGIGRKVSGITNGHYIVIAPELWERKGHVPVAPDGCSDGRFMAHYFYRDDCSSSDIGGFREFEVSLLKSSFELTGKRVLDDSADGELFVGDVPALRTPQQVSHVRIGSEDASGWRGKNFRPHEQVFSEILNNRQGRFFVRVYDENLDMLDSGEFRYLRDLGEIRVNGEPHTRDTVLLPPATGYGPTSVRFVCADGAIIRPVPPPELKHVTLRGSELIVNPHPDGIKIECALKSESGSVDIVVDLPFVWWRIEGVGEGPDAWQDIPLAMSRYEFRDHAYADAAVRLRLPPRLKAVRVGFDDEPGQSYSRDANSGDLQIPLVDFVDHSQIDNRLTEDASLNIACDGGTLTLIRVSADPIPEIVSFSSEAGIVRIGEQATLSWTTRHAEDASVSINPELVLVRKFLTD